jgi:hypothetical protein
MSTFFHQEGYLITFLQFGIFRMAMSEQHRTTPTTSTTMWNSLFESLPGGDLVREGFADLERGVMTAPALLLLIGGPRLRSLGLPVPRTDNNPEHALYQLLSQDDSNSAHSRFNALIRTLVSFERAAECARR